MRRRSVLLAAALGVAVTAPARADDGSAGVPLPGLTAQPKGSVRAVASELMLDGDGVVLHLHLQTKAAPSAVELRGPLFSWLGAAETYPDRHFPELKAELNGTPFAPSTAFAASAGGRDISADLSSLGLDPFTIVHSPPVIDPAPAADSAAFKRLIARGALQANDGQTWARWNARRLWRFDLPNPDPGADSGPGPRDGTAPPKKLTLSYKARPALALVPAAGIDRAVRLSTYCISPTQWRERLASLNLADSALLVRSYAIAAGVDGQAAVKLTVQSSSPQTFFCGASGKPAFGGTAPAPARSDRAGVVHVMQVDKAG